MNLALERGSCFNPSPSQHRTNGLAKELANLGRGGEVAVLADLAVAACVVAVERVLQSMAHILGHRHRAQRLDQHAQVALKGTLSGLSSEERY